MNTHDLIQTSRLQKRLSGPKTVECKMMLVGIFGGGGFLGSGAKTTVANTTTNVNQEDYSGTVAREGSSLTITQREESPEALEAARQIALGGFDLGARSVQAAENAGQAVVAGQFRALDFAGDITDKNLGTIKSFGDSAFSTVEQSLGRVSGAYETAANYQERALSGALDFSAEILGASQKTIGSTVTALQEIGREQNKSTDERLAEVSGNAIKYVTIAIAAVGLGLLAWSAMKGK